MSDNKIRFYTTNSDEFTKVGGRLNLGFKTMIPPNKDTQQEITLTDCNIRKNFSHIDYTTTLPFKGRGNGGGNIEAENSLFMPQLSSSGKKKTTLSSVTSDQFYNKHFYIFENTVKPDAELVVETKDKGFLTGRYGLSTRFL